MIRLSRMDGKPIVLNAELIQSVEPTPDTIITMMSGEKLMVRETVEVVVAAFKKYKREISDRSITGDRS